MFGFSAAELLLILLMGGALFLGLAVVAIVLVVANRRGWSDGF